MNNWRFINSTIPQNTYISNELGMPITIWNETDEEISILFPDYGHLETFQPWEKKFFNRFVDNYMDFLISPPSVSKYNIPKYVNNVVIKKAGPGVFQPAFFFSTRKFVG